MTIRAQILKIFRDIVTSISILVMHLNNFRNFLVSTCYTLSGDPSIIEDFSKGSSTSSSVIFCFTVSRAVFCLTFIQSLHCKLSIANHAINDRIFTRHPLCPATMRAKVVIIGIYGGLFPNDFFSACVARCFYLLPSMYLSALNRAVSSCSSFAGMKQFSTFCAVSSYISRSIVSIPLALFRAISDVPTPSSYIFYRGITEKAFSCHNSSLYANIEVFV